VGDVVDAMQDRIGITNEFFQKSLVKIMGDPAYLPQIQKIRQENEECKFEKITLPENLKDVFKTESSKKCEQMTKKELMGIHKDLHFTTVEHMKKLKQMNLQQMDLQQELNLIPQFLSDKLFEAEGIESEDLDAATERLDLESDAEY